MSEDSVMRFALALGLGILIGMFWVMIFTSTGGTTMVRNEFLDNVCNNTFGEEYAYDDDEWFGVDKEITCKKIYELKDVEDWIKISK